ncbi:venom carboxylesterase-6-like isoform X2 [Thrips palmi]|nr:venom carboxylesterase-6-like isoform X2 [Thrips palmi]
MKPRPQVKTDSGPICGHEVKSPESNIKYFSFQGIPYARPPIGELRFKPPEPVESWTEVKDCCQERDVCIQHHMYLRNLQGSEDCLYLNVYTPQLPFWGSSNLPVMVRLHGGGFTTGSGNTDMTGPDFIVKERVLLVTINYRLSVFGFLCVDEPGDGQGNMGLKDQVAALRWIQRNISNFGGDPKKVTISGESAGGASVHLHMMSPMSKGLFSSAICESGVALNPWAFTNQGRERAFHLGESLGFKGNNAKDLVKYLKTIPADRLTEAAAKNSFSKEEKEYSCVVKPFPFVPSVEITDGSVEPFLCENPVKILQEGRFFRGPFLAGVNNREAILLLAAIMGKERNEMLKKFDSRIPKLVPADLSLARGSPEESKVAELIRWQYMKNKPLTEENLVDYFNLTGDLMFVHGFYCAMKYHCKFSAPYLYEFSYEGALNVFRNVLAVDHVRGACHADELGYLFKMDLLPSSDNVPIKDLKMREKFVKMWTNFVKFGHPTPRTDSSLDVAWLPASQRQATYLEIGPTIQNIKGAIAERRMLFWDNMYAGKEKLRNNL